MLIIKNDEDERSRIWRIATIVSSILIVLIAVYLLTKLFTSNPLEGRWEDEDGSFGITIKSSGVMIVNIPDLAEDTNVEVQMNYTLDKEAKTISIRSEEEDLKKISEKEDGRYTLEMLQNAVSPVENTFDYSLDKRRLTLTEREYGEQMIFQKK